MPSIVDSERKTQNHVVLWTICLLNSVKMSRSFV